MEKTCFVLAYLTSQGRVPLLGLNDIIAGVLRGWPSCRVGWLLLQSFYQCRLATNTNTGQERRVTLLLHSHHIGKWSLTYINKTRTTELNDTNQKLIWCHVSSSYNGRFISKTVEDYVCFISSCSTKCIITVLVDLWVSLLVLSGLLIVLGVPKRMEWLLELMGLIRNVAYGATCITCGDTRLVCSWPITAWYF